MKTELTKDIERAIYSASGADKLGFYGCFEVSFGAGYGDQYCDFVTMASDNIFRCYEIKITASDFRSKSKLSFVGDYNYFVMPTELYEAVRTDIPWGIGVYLYKNGKCYSEKKARKRIVTIGQRVDLMYGMIRSLSRYTTKIVKGAVGK
jgi:hypothetical protein